MSPTSQSPWAPPGAEQTLDKYLLMTGWMSSFPVEARGEEVGDARGE